MFEHDKRENLIDLLRPPSGYRLEAAVGTTYSLDFVALTAAMLAFVDGEVEAPGATDGHVDALHAITRLASRVRVFVNRGQIGGPQKVSSLTILYDRIVREVCLPEGCFHPKTWVMHYRARQRPGVIGEPDVVRFVCASRNLTTSQYWEAFVACEGQGQPGKGSTPIAAEIREFLARLAREDTEPASPIDDLRGVLGRTRFDLPRHMQDEAHFSWQWHGGQGLVRRLPASGRRALLVSPFVRKSFLADMLKRFDRLVVISTQHELDAITDEALIARLTGGGNRVFVVEAADADDGSTAMELHAKLLVCEDAEGTRTFLGSANASDSAWGGRNCEAMVSFAPGISIDHFCDRFVYTESPAPPGGRRPLRGWISEYRRQQRAEDEQDRAEQKLNDVCREIGRLQIAARYNPGEQSLRLEPGPGADTFVTPMEAWSTSHDIQVSLLSLLDSDAALKPLSGLFAGGITFANLAVADLTDFLVLQVTERRTGLRRRFVLKALSDFSHLRDDRDAQLLQRLLTRDSLLAFLRAILFDAAGRPFDRPPQGGRGGKWEAPVTQLLTQTSIEEVIQACTEDSTRIEEINRLIKAFEKTGWIDEEFLLFWSTFTEAEAEAGKGAVRG